MLSGQGQASECRQFSMGCQRLQKAVKLLNVSAFLWASRPDGLADLWHDVANVALKWHDVAKAAVKSDSVR